MAIIFMNLMVGLAVDDIQAIQDNAEFQKLSLNVSSMSNMYHSKQNMIQMITENISGWTNTRSGTLPPNLEKNPLQWQNQELPISWIQRRTQRTKMYTCKAQAQTN